jgi:hypothetical protein
MYKIQSYKIISDILVSYYPKLDTDVITSHNLDIVKLVNKYKDHEIQELNVASLAISAATTA